LESGGLGSYGLGNWGGGENELQELSNASVRREVFKTGAFRPKSGGPVQGGERMDTQTRFGKKGDVLMTNGSKGHNIRNSFKGDFWSEKSTEGGDWREGTQKKGGG